MLVGGTTKGQEVSNVQTWNRGRIVKHQHYESMWSSWGRAVADGLATQHVHSPPPPPLPPPYLQPPPSTASNFWLYYYYFCTFPSLSTSGRSTCSSSPKKHVVTLSAPLYRQPPPPTDRTTNHTRRKARIPRDTIIIMLCLACSSSFAHPLGLPEFEYYTGTTHLHAITHPQLRRMVWSASYDIRGYLSTKQRQQWRGKLKIRLLLLFICFCCCHSNKKNTALFAVQLAII